ncbi:TPA: DUF87 domain-containing protein, partial [Candidatus Woesearchaeota archaeon]|nr:DUF87 domain-containing protein [Candidatus Woesearchaeota archaeon]
VAGQSLNITYNLTFGAETITNATYNVSISGVECNLTVSNGSVLVCNASNVTDGRNHNLTLTAIYPSERGNITLRDSYEVGYLDVTPPNISMIAVWYAAAGYNISFNATVTDNVGVLNVTAVVTFPDRTNQTRGFTYSDGVYKSYFTATQGGYYDIIVYANDSVGNTASLKSRTEGYRLKTFTGYAVDLNNHSVYVRFVINDTFWNITTEATTNTTNGFYNFTVWDKVQDMLFELTNFTISMYSVNFSNLSSADFFRIDSVSPTDVNLNSPVNGFSIDSYLPYASGIEFRYVEATIGYSEDYLKVFKCLNWTFATRVCQVNWWVQVPFSINKITNRLYSNITSFTSGQICYFVAEEVPQDYAELTLPQDEVVATINHGTKREVNVTIQSTGTLPVTSITVSCISGEVCSNFTVTSASISSLPVGVSADIGINVTVPLGFNPGVYAGTLSIVSSNQNQQRQITVIVPTNRSWLVAPESFSITTGSEAIGTIGTLNITNEGNAQVNLTLNYSSIYTINSTVGIQKQSTLRLPVNYYAPSSIGSYSSTLNISSSDTSKYVNLTLAVNQNVSIINISQTGELQGGESLRIYATASYMNTSITSNINWDVTISNVSCSGVASSYSATNAAWIITCSAPTLTAHANNLTLTAYFVDYSAIAYARKTIYYVDITPPVLVGYTDRALVNTLTNIFVNLSDETNISSVTATMLMPNSSTASYVLQRYQGSNFTFYFNDSYADIGDYNITITVTDYYSNTLTTDQYFEVYRIAVFSGDIKRANGNGVAATINLYNSRTNERAASVATSSDGSYSIPIYNRTYDLEIIFFDNYSLYVKNLNLPYLYDPIDLDEVPLYMAGIANSRNLRGFAAKTNFTAEGNVSMIYDMTGLNSMYAVYLYKCSDWNYTAQRCNSSWERLTSYTQDVGKISGSIASFSAYVASELIYEIPAAVYQTTTVSAGGGGGGGGVTGAAAGGGGATIIRSEVNLSGVYDILKGLMGPKELRELKVDTTEISKRMYPGEASSARILMRSTFSKDIEVRGNVSGRIKEFVFLENPVFDIASGEEKFMNLKIFVPGYTEPGLYDGYVHITAGNESFDVPVDIRVMLIEEKLLDVKVQPIVDKISPGQTLRMQIDLYNLGKEKRVDVQLKLELVSPITDEIIITKEEAIAVETTVSVIKSMQIPRDIELGKYIIRGTAYYSNNNQTMRATSLAYIEVVKYWYDYTIFGVRVGYVAIILVSILVTGVLLYYWSWRRAHRARYRSPISLTTLPQPSPRSGFIGKIAETGVRTFVNLDSLTTHTLVAGSTGGGKSVAAQVVVEEALKKNIAVLVFDPTAQWTGMLRKCVDRAMLRRYRYFDMNRNQAQAFNGNVFIVKDVVRRIDVKSYIEPGKINIFALNFLKPEHVDFFVSEVIKQIFESNPEESPNLKMILVFDEVHRLMPKFGGTGNGFLQIERACREFRKWGIGLVLASQVLSDFVGEIKANIGTEIQFRTRYEADLERIKMKYGEAVQESVIKSATGTGMIVNAAYNIGRPYFISFRPLLHSTKRLSDAELDQYDSFNKRLAEVRRSINQLEQSGVEVFDLEMELKLALSKLSIGAFNMVSMYLDGLEPRLDAEWKRIGRRPVKSEGDYYSDEELRLMQSLPRKSKTQEAGLQEARREAKRKTKQGAKEKAEATPKEGKAEEAEAAPVKRRERINWTRTEDDRRKGAKPKKVYKARSKRNRSGKKNTSRSKAREM